MARTNFEVELFDGKNYFSLWQSTVKDILVHRGLIKALYGKTKKSATMSDDEWEELETISVSTICLNLAIVIDKSIVLEERVISTMIGEEDQALLLLTSLPHLYDTLVTTIVKVHPGS
jgi:hypothetical protein